MSLQVYTSRKNDGSMKPVNGDDVVIAQNRSSFLNKYGISPDSTTLLHLTYGGDDYTRYLTVGDDLKGDGIVRDSTIEVDAIVTTSPDHALFLPLADCIGAVIHDPAKNILMLSHLGRHNLEQSGGTRSIEYLVREFGTDPTNLTVWLSPAAGQENYPLFSFNNRGMHEVATKQLLTAGILAQNITVSPEDTTTSKDYFSHSQFLAGNRETDGRFAVVAIMN